MVLNGCDFLLPKSRTGVSEMEGVILQEPESGEDIFSYINRTEGRFNQHRYQQILGAANAFKEGDESLNLAAVNEENRLFARDLISNTTLGDLNKHVVFTDDLLVLIQESIIPNLELNEWTIGDLKTFVLNSSEADIKAIMPSLSSDNIACLVKILTNEELIQLGQKVFNPLPGSKIGSKGYMGARVQPNSPTDNTEDISWQVFDAWSYAVGDVVLGTNPVSSEPDSVAKIEYALQDIIKTFDLEQVIPNCVLAHVDIQAEVERLHPGTTGIWFQSLAGTVEANKTFDVTLDKMLEYAAQRNGHFGFYAETGQGADFTNGHASGFDMLMHESRKYGFLRVLKGKIAALKGDTNAWVHVNDVAGFIGPEVFRTREQLVRCCLEDTVMGKLHGLTIGLDICSTLHMDVNLRDLDWCIEQVMPVNPAYLMALPTKNDPMLSYLTTAFNNHVKIREQFGYKVNDTMWDFFKHLGVINEFGEPGEHFGNPKWVYYQYCKRKGDTRTQAEIFAEGETIIKRIEGRGVPIAQGYGEKYWDLAPNLENQVNRLYEDAKISLWTEFDSDFPTLISNSLAIATQSKDRKDYVYHPTSGELLSKEAKEKLRQIRGQWQGELPDIQLIISDGLNARAIMDDNHLLPYLNELYKILMDRGYSVSKNPLLITNGRVRAGYACGEILFGTSEYNNSAHGIIHLIGERPGSGHHNYSAYITVAQTSTWKIPGTVDHNITRVISGISDTALHPVQAALDSGKIVSELFLLNNVKKELRLS